MSKIKNKAKQIWKYLKKEDGWTIVETMIVITIAMILTAMVGITAIKQVGKAKAVKAQTEIESYSLALTAYYLDCGSYPGEESGLEALYKNPGSADGWNGPYLTRSVSKDPWGNDYIYRIPGPDGQDFALLSYGSDGMEGGEGDAADLVSW